MSFEAPGIFACCGQRWREYRGWAYCYRCGGAKRFHGRNWKTW